MVFNYIMINTTTGFERSNLPFNQQMLSFWKENGFLIINNFYNFSECDSLVQRAKYLIENYKRNNKILESVFETKDQKHAQDKYFL